MDQIFQKSEFLKAIFPDRDILDNETIRQVLTVFLYPVILRKQSLDNYIKLPTPSKIQFNRFGL